MKFSDLNLANVTEFLLNRLLFAEIFTQRCSTIFVGIAGNSR